jgi:NADPH2:quinone reductase
MTRRRMSRASVGSPPAIPASMKAAAIDRFGPPSTLTLHDVSVPTPGPHEVLIAIETAGIGNWDASIRDGSLRQPGRPRFPLVPGVDGAGVVVAKGARVRRFRLGDHVYAYEFANRQGGFYAEFAAADAAHVARIAKGLDLRDAGAVATTGLTALQGLDALELRPGHTVLIFGASGAVGTMAVQCAGLRHGRESAAIRAAESAPHGGPDSCADHSTLSAGESRPGASAIGSATRAGADGPADTSRRVTPFDSSSPPSRASRP